MMKCPFTCFCLAALFFAFLSPLFAQLHVDVGCTSAVLINSKTGKVLFEKNASKPMYPASCTKIAFTLYAIKFHESLFNKRLITSRNAVKSMPEAQKGNNNYTQVPSYVLVTDASHMGLKVGEEMNFYDLLEASMVVSADDASNVLAEAMGNGSIDKCVDDVNRYITTLGLSATSFKNPHGLHHPEHVTTAFDLAKLSQEAMKEPLFRKMANTPRFLRPKTNKQPPVHLQSTNRLIVKGSNAHYAPAIGIKTGYHSRAGRCLVAAAEKDDRSLIAVVLQSATRDDRFNDAKKLFQAAFLETKITNTYVPAGPQALSREFIGGAMPLSTYTTEAIAYSYYPSDEPQMQLKLVWHDISLPLKKGASVGELHFHADGQLVRKTTLFAAAGVEETFLHTITKGVRLWLLCGFVGLVSVALLLLFKKRNPRY